MLLNSRQIIAKKVSEQLNEGEVVNLGIGPTLVASFLNHKIVYLHSENGLIGMDSPAENQIDLDLIDASGGSITVLPGAAFFDSAFSFGMIRGGHVDVTILGALQVDFKGEIAN